MNNLLTFLAQSVVVPDAIGKITVSHILVFVSFVIGVAGIIAYAYKLLKPWVNSMRNFLDDWNGEEARPGVSKRPGVMERLLSLEKAQNEIKHEVQPNSGNSMYDKLSAVHKHITNAFEQEEPEPRKNEQGKLF